MDEAERKQLKEELMKPDWTESLHLKLEDLRPEDAKAIVESMDETEIYSKVNNRQFQQDYIADYIEYLWEISEPAYWNHVKISLDVAIGLLWSDNMSHVEKMCGSKIPDDVMATVLDFAVRCHESSTQDIEAIGCVIKAQVERFGREHDLIRYVSSLDEDKRQAADKRLREMIKRTCPYRFL